MKKIIEKIKSLAMSIIRKLAQVLCPCSRDEEEEVKDER